MCQIRTIIIATEEDRIYAPLRKSAKRCGYELEILGVGHQYISNGSKLKIVHDYLCTTQFSPSTFIMFVDAYDCIFVRPYPDLVEEVYNLLGPNRMLIGSEKQCWPKPDWKARLYRGGTYPYLNSGTWIAEPTVAREVCRRLVRNRGYEYIDDQLLFQNDVISNNSAPYVVNDTEAEFTHCMYAAENDLHVKDMVVTNIKTNTYPFIVHGNGGADLSRLVKQLDL